MTRILLSGLLFMGCFTHLQATPHNIPDNSNKNSSLIETDFAQIFDSLCINHKQLVYDRNNQTYYYSLPDSVLEGKTFNFEFSYLPKQNQTGQTVQLDPAFYPLNNGYYAITNPDCETLYSLTLHDADGKQTSRAFLRFTFLPLVEISLDRCSANHYTPGAIRVTDGNHSGTDSLYKATFRYRGNTSLRYDKKSFNIKLKDADGKSMDHSFFGLRSDNRWILDAMTIDGSCMRNRIAMDLWNDFATLPYYADEEKNVRTGTRGQFVEVFWNGEYHGLFCMSERIDRKQLKLKKFVPSTESPQGKDEVHGLLYKGKECSYEVLMGCENGTMPGHAPAGYTNTLGQERWCYYDFKYPDYEDEAVEWKPLYDCVNFVATSSQYKFDSNLYRYMDIPVLIDYYLFIDMILATDNVGKNMYFFTYDSALPAPQKISIAPWDLDASFGIDWQGNTDIVSPIQTVDDYYGKSNNAYFQKLMKSRKIDWMSHLSFRYARLRFSHFSNEALKERFLTYGERFALSGADVREQDRWGGRHSDLQEGVQYACSWIDAHIKHLDEYYGFDPTLSAINEADAERYFRVYGHQGSLTVVSRKEQSVQIFNLSGQLVRQLHVTEGETRIDGLSPGVYLVNSLKVLVK